jgi:two-component system chemotaxis response regulator CheB
MNNATNLPDIETIVIGTSAGGVEALLNSLGRLLVELERIAC